MTVQETRHRVFVFVATAFFISSVIFCTNRLFSSSFTSEVPFSSLDQSPLKQQQQQQQQIHVSAADYPMSYGAYNRPGVDGLTLVANLPDRLVPTFENKRRLIIVGDIHGMDAALGDLLDEVRFDPRADHLVATGDMIDKGPDSPAVISRLIRLGASAVRGNHEDRLLLALADADAERKGQAGLLATGRKLSKEHLAWLFDLPVILAVEPLRMYVVHAGLVPGVPPERQDPWAVMNMRTLVYPREQIRKKTRYRRRDGGEVHDDDDDAPEKDAQEKDDDDDDNDDNPTKEIDGGEEKEEEEDEDEEAGETDQDIKEKDAFTDRDVAVPVAGRDGEAWARAWNRYQKRLKKKKRRTVVYGHDSKRGYREGRYTFGIDTACVKGGTLTALVVEGAEGGGFTQTVRQVKCKAP